MSGSGNNAANEKLVRSGISLYSIPISSPSAESAATRLVHLLQDLDFGLSCVGLATTISLSEDLPCPVSSMLPLTYLYTNTTWHLCLDPRLHSVPYTLHQ